MTDQKASKFYPAEDEMQMKKVHISLTTLQSFFIAHLDLCFGEIGNFSSSYDLQIENRHARPRTLPNTARLWHPAPF
jgi:hypothetical protein